MHTKMKVTFAGSSTLFGCTVTLDSPTFVGVIVGVGKTSFISELEILGVMVADGSCTMGDEALRVGTVTDLIFGRFLAILHDYINSLL